MCLGYVESHEDLLETALYSIGHAFNKVNQQRIDPVFFREAILHAARISRVMVKIKKTHYSPPPSIIYSCYSPVILTQFRAFLSVFLSYFFQAMPGGHAVLLGVSYCTGRGMLVRLAAHFCNAKVKPSMSRLHTHKNRILYVQNSTRAEICMYVLLFF